MDAKELNKERAMTYDELCLYLKRKYGEIKEPYFVNESCRTPNHRIKRTSEGLVIHHIKENDVPDLTKLSNAKKAPFSYQSGENLVYCNYLEHLLLHLCILNEYFSFEDFLQNKRLLGLLGITDHIVPAINDYFDGFNYSREWQIKAFKLIEDNYSEYLNILHDVVVAINKRGVFSVCGYLFDKDRKFFRKIGRFNSRPYEGIKRSGDRLKLDYDNLFAKKTKTGVNY